MEKVKFRGKPTPLLCGGVIKGWWGTVIANLRYDRLSWFIDMGISFPVMLILYVLAVENGSSYGAFEDMAIMGILLSANSVILGIYCGIRTVSRIRMGDKKGVAELYSSLPVSHTSRLTAATVTEILRYTVCVTLILILFLGIEIVRGINLTEVWIGVPAVIGMLLGYFIMYYALGFLSAVLSDSIVFQMSLIVTFWIGNAAYLAYSVVVSEAFSGLSFDGYAATVSERIASGCATFYVLLIDKRYNVPEELYHYGENLVCALIVAAVLLVLCFATVALRRRFDGFELREIVGVRASFTCVASVILFLGVEMFLLSDPYFISDILRNGKFFTLGLLGEQTYLLAVFIYLAVSFLINGMRKWVKCLTLLPTYLLIVIAITESMFSH